MKPISYLNSQDRYLPCAYKADIKWVCDYDYRYDCMGSSPDHNPLEGPSLVFCGPVGAPVSAFQERNDRMHAA